LTVFQLVNDAVPYSPHKSFPVGEFFVNSICNSPQVYQAIQLALRCYFENPADLLEAGLRVPLNFESLSACLPKERVVVAQERSVLPRLRQTDTFKLISELLGWRQNVTVLLREGGEVHGAFPIWRSADQKPFSKEDLRFLQACAPHLSHGLRNAQLIQQRATPSAEEFLPSSIWDTGVILIDSAGRIVAIDAPARSAFKQLRRLDGTRIDKLDDRARDILEYVHRVTLSTFRDPALVGPAPMIRTFAHWSGAILKLRGAVAEAPDGRQYVTVIVERGETALLRRQRTMLRWGLSEREAEVLDFVRTGKTNAEIGVILGASTLTVKKHLEHIIEKLGVETRTAAAALVLGTA
jgi:DNA-binding CsgD family transcriptional regulator